MEGHGLHDNLLDKDNLWVTDNIAAPKVSAKFGGFTVIAYLCILSDIYTVYYLCYADQLWNVKVARVQ